MRCEDLTADQLDAIHAKVHASADYLNKLVARMNEQRFPHHDKLHSHVADARQSMYRLCELLAQMSREKSMR